MLPNTCVVLSECFSELFSVDAIKLISTKLAGKDVTVAAVTALMMSYYSVNNQGNDLVEVANTVSPGIKRFVNQENVGSLLWFPIILFTTYMVSTHPHF